MLSGARICSCHFVNNKKQNRPTILSHCSQQFDSRHLTPEKNFPKTLFQLNPYH